MIKFGVAGNSNSFFLEGYSQTFEAAEWCRLRNIDLFEYSFGHGVNMKEETANIISDAFKEANVFLSAHAPYYINMANIDKDMIDKSIMYIFKSMEKAKQMGATRVVVHPASQGKLDRKRANEIMLANIRYLADMINEKNIANKEIILCWETMGKVRQMGTVDEIIEICKIDNNFFPCIDFGHINAREQGILDNPEIYNTILRKLRDNLEKNKFLHMHIHFSKIQYSEKGEIRHLTFDNTTYGPNFEPLAEMLVKYNLEPWIVCESDGTQAEDAIIMKNIFQNYKL